MDYSLYKCISRKSKGENQLITRQILWCIFCNVTIPVKVTRVTSWIWWNKLTDLAQAEGASTEILCSYKLRINFLWKSFTGFIMLCNAQKSIPVTDTQEISYNKKMREIQAKNQLVWTNHTCDNTSSPWIGRVTLQHPIQLHEYQQQSLHLV